MFKEQIKTGTVKKVDLTIVPKRILIFFKYALHVYGIDNVSIQYDDYNKYVIIIYVGDTNVVSYDKLGKELNKHMLYDVFMIYRFNDKTISFSIIRSKYTQNEYHYNFIHPHLSRFSIDNDFILSTNDVCLGTSQLKLLLKKPYNEIPKDELKGYFYNILFLGKNFIQTEYNPDVYRSIFNINSINDYKLDINGIQNYETLLYYLINFEYFDDIVNNIKLNGKKIRINRDIHINNPSNLTALCIKSDGEYYGIATSNTNQLKELNEYAIIDIIFKDKFKEIQIIDDINIKKDYCINPQFIIGLEKLINGFLKYIL